MVSSRSSLIFTTVSKERDGHLYAKDRNKSNPATTMEKAMTWDQESYIKAWNYASTIHQGQSLPGSDLPYLNHLGLVAMEAMAAINNGIGKEDPTLLIQCALLHDSIEDTECSFDDIEALFGREVAAGVLALSKDRLLATKKEQIEDSILRIKAQPRSIWMVKLCDRITNLQPPPAHWKVEKVKRYQQEAHYILENLGESNLYLANRLSGKIHNYSRFFKA